MKIRNNYKFLLIMMSQEIIQFNSKPISKKTVKMILQIQFKMNKIKKASYKNLSKFVYMFQKNF